MTMPRLAKDYQTLIVAYRNGSAVRLSGRGRGLRRGGECPQPGHLQRQARHPGADHQAARRQCHPGGGPHPARRCRSCKAALPVAIDLGILFDTTTSIRNSVHDVEMTLILSTILVILVVFLFLRNFKATLVPTRLRAAVAAGHLRGDVSAGLQPGQFLADGADRLHRLCGRQHHRGAGERHPPSGKWRRPHDRGAARAPARSASPCCP